MMIIPAIDLRGGCCVRLQQGDYAKETIYDQQPVAVAQRWADAGARRLHLVDLDGAKDGRPCHGQIIKEIAGQCGIPVDVGGGIRELDVIDDYLQNGVAYIILGSVAVENPALVEEACRRYPGRISVGIDARNGKVATKGWLEESTKEALVLAGEMKDLGVKEIIYTDIARDGMLSGPNIPALEEMARASGLSVIASGGVSCLADLILLKTLEPLGVSGAIVGKAIYDGRLDLKEAIRRLEGAAEDVG